MDTDSQYITTLIAHYKQVTKLVLIAPLSSGFRGGALGASAPPAESMVKIS